jgi:membrane protein
MNKIDDPPRTKIGELWQLTKITFREWWNDDTFRLAASLAFYTIFSIAPVLLIVVGVATLFYARDTAIDRIVSEIQTLVGNRGAQAVRDVLEASSGFGKSVWAILTGVVTFLFGASAVFAELQSALNKVWDVHAEPRRGVILQLVFDRLRSFGIALGVGFLLLVSLVISAAISALQGYLESRMPGMPAFWQTINIIVSFLVVAALFAMIYKFLPDARIRWKDVWVGAAVSSALFTGGKYVIGVYLGHTATASTFGAAGSLAILLIWVYYSALVSFLGAEFTQVYARRHGVPIEPKTHAVRTGKKPDEIVWDHNGTRRHADGHDLIM